jgi:hypothetical protein
MHRTRIVGGVILVATGLVWVGQGLGLLRSSSFMVGDPTWVVLGVVGAVLGAFVTWLGLRGQA